jgi:UDP-N-acetyl-D-mannosaminuronate dehydrogenase
VLGYDPLANEMARAELQDQAVILDSLEECLSQADMVLITTPDPIFRSLTAADFDENSSVIVVDFWRILEKELAGRENIRYIPVGRSLDDEANAQRLQELWGIGEF